MRKGKRRFAALARAAGATWRVLRGSLRERRPEVDVGGAAVAQALEPRVMLAGGQELAIIGVTGLRTDPRFAGIDGRGNSIVIIDDAFDVSHFEFKTTGPNPVSRVAY